MRTSKNRTHRSLLLVPVALSVCMAVVAFGVASILPKRYKSEATLYFPAQGSDTSGLAGLASSISRGMPSGNLGDGKGSVSLAFGALSSPLIASGPQAAIAILDSNRCRKIVVQQLDLAKKWDLSPSLAVKRLEAQVSLGIDKNNLLAMEVDESDRNLAKQILDSYIDALGKLSTELSLTVSSKNRKFLEQRVGATRVRMQQLERKLLDATVSDPNVAELNAPSEAAKGLVELEGKLNEAKVNLAGIDKQLAYTQDKARSALKSGADLPATSELGKTQREKLAGLEYEFALAKQELGPDHPRYRALQDQLVTARRQLNQEIARESRALESGIEPTILKLSADKAGLEAQVAGLTRFFDQVHGRLAAIPTRQMRRARLEYELKAVREQLFAYELDLGKAKIAEDRDAITYQVVDEPEVADEPFAPRRLFTAAMAGVAGLLIGIAFLVARSSFRPDPLELAVEREVAVV